MGWALRWKPKEASRLQRDELEMRWHNDIKYEQELGEDGDLNRG